MKTSIIAVWLSICATVIAADAARRVYSVAEIDTAIRAGKAGTEYAERARKMEDLHVRESRDEKIPYQVFTFSDFRGGYTLLVESDDRFVVLCTAFGGGYADDFSLKRENDRTTLYYRYTSGSGRIFEHRARYVIGSGQPEEIGSRRDVTDERRRRLKLR